MTHPDPDLDEKIRRGMAEHNVRRCAAAYALSGNAIHIWEAYRECRKLKLPPPAWALAYFDECADRLLDQDTPEQVADAFKLRVGGRSPATRRRKDKEDLSLLLTIRKLERMGEKNREEIFDQIAEDFAMDRDSLKNRYYELQRRLK